MMKAVCAALVACAVAPALLAAPGPMSPLAKSSTIMKLNGVNLATAEGQRVLAIRMDQAARDVCGERLSNIHLALEAESRACRAEVKADIRSRIEQRTADAGQLTQAGSTRALR
jgi:UrcA family protein